MCSLTPHGVPSLREGKTHSRVATYAMIPFEEPKSVEEVGGTTLARLWNVSEERVTKRPIQSHHHALQRSFLAFPGRATQKIRWNS